MIDTEAPPRPISPALRTLGWVGLWLCSASLLPVLMLWSHFSTPHQSLLSLQPGTSLFWTMLGLDALFASLLTFLGPLLPRQMRRAAGEVLGRVLYLLGF